MFETSNFILPDKVFYKKDLEHKSVFWTKVKEFMSTSDLVCNEIVASSQKYKKGDIVVLEVTGAGDEITVGLIEIVLVKKDDVFFVVRRYIALKQQLGFYETENVDEYVFCAAKKLVDYKPIIMHGTTNKFQFVTHHHLSHSQS